MTSTGRISCRLPRSMVEAVDDLVQREPWRSRRSIISEAIHRLNEREAPRAP